MDTYALRPSMLSTIWVGQLALKPTSPKGAESAPPDPTVWRTQYPCCVPATTYSVRPSRVRAKPLVLTAVLTVGGESGESPSAPTAYCAMVSFVNCTLLRT